MDNFADLPDFVTLYTKDAVTPAPTNLEFKWNLPDSYYSPDRVSTCFVSLAGVFGDFSTVTAGDAIAVVMKDGATNYSSTDNRGLVLGGVYDNNVAAFKPITQGLIQPLIASKPKTIEIHFTELDGTPLTFPVGFLAIITLRFDYIRAREQITGLESTFQKNLL